MNKDMQVVRLERRVLHLERKLVVWASRMKKDVIWRKFLEDWILQKFNFDLRLQVELKTLDEDGVDEFEKYEGSGAATATPTTSLAQNVSNLQRVSQPFSGSRGGKINQRVPPGRQMKHGTSSVSIAGTGVSRIGGLRRLPMDNPDPLAISRKVSITVINKSGDSDGSGVSYRPVQHQSVQKPSLSTANTPEKVTGQLGLGASPVRKRLHLATQRQTKNISPPHPIIVSTTSFASGNPSQPQPELLVRTNPLTPNKSGTQPLEVILLDDDDDCPQPNQNPNNNVSSSSTNTAQSQNFVDSGSNPPNPSQVTYQSQQTQAISQAQQLPLQHPVTSSNCSVGGIREEHYPDSSFQNVEFTRNLVLDEAPYVAGGYLRRVGEHCEKIEFDIKKILQHQDPFVTDNILSDIVQSQRMSQQAKKNITSALGDFLMTVYGENPPRVARESMAESLAGFFQFVPKDIWWYKIPNKNPAGCLEHRIQNKRRHIVEERKRQQTSTTESNASTVNPLQGSYSQQAPGESVPSSQ